MRLPKPETLGDYFDLQRGTTYKSSLKGFAGPILLGLASIERNGGFRQDKLTTYGGDSPEKLLVRPGELFVSLKDVTQAGDLLGAVARVPPTVPVGRLTQDTVKLVPTRTNPPLAYLYWLLRTPEVRGLCRSRATGTTNLGLAREDFLSIPVPVMTDERARIVELLEAIEERLMLHGDTNRTLEAMAQALFKSWFIDFDGHDDLVESEIGLVPRGWAVVPLAQTGRWISGGTPSKQNDAYWGGSIPWFSAKSLGPLWLTDSDDRLTEAGADAGTRRVPRRSVLFIVRGMSLATEWRIGMTTREATLNQDLKAIVDDGTVLPELTLMWLLGNREIIRAKADEAGHGTKRLPTEVLHAHALAVPPRPQQERMAAPLVNLLARIEQNLAECTSLAALRDALLPKLISGELRVPEADEQVEEALKTIPPAAERRHA